MRGSKAKAVRRQERRIKDLGERWGNDPTNEDLEAELDAAQRELRRLKKKGEPVRSPF